MTIIMHQIKKELSLHNTVLTDRGDQVFPPLLPKTWIHRWVTQVIGTHHA